MNETQASPSSKRSWQKWTIGGALSVGLAVIAGFASPEVRKATCLDLPPVTDLNYELSPGTLPLDALDTNTEQRLMDGKPVKFQARVYGEAGKVLYSSLWDSKMLVDQVVANIRPLDYEDRGTPFGSELTQPPPVAAVLPTDLAGELATLQAGTVVEFEGKATYLTRAPPGSPMGKANAQMAAFNAPVAETPLLDWADFYVEVSSIHVVKPSNEPRDRVLCRLFHDLPD